VKRKRHLLPRPKRPRAATLVGAPPGTVKAPANAHPTTVRVIDYSGEELTELEATDLSALREHLERNSVTWVDVVGLEDADRIAALGDLLGISRLVLEDVLNVGQRPRMEGGEESVFFVSRLVRFEQTLELEQLSLVFGERFVVTFQERPGDCFDAVRERLRAGRRRIRGNGPDYLAYALIDVMIDSCFPVEERCRESLEEIEDDIVLGAGRDAIGRIHAVKRNVRVLRRIVSATGEAVHGLLNPDVTLVSEPTRPYLADCWDHSRRLADALEADRELSNDLVDLHLAHQGQRLNEIMKVLTIFAALFIPLTFIAGIYGMNFDSAASRWNMPELGWAYGYPAALGAMALVAVALVLYFVRKGWIGRGE
jgi:magnesium transporter